MVATVIGILCPLYLFWTQYLGFQKLGSSGSATTRLPDLNVSALDILVQYWIEHVTFGLLCQVYILC